MVVQDRQLRRLPQKFLLSTVTPSWFWTRDQRDHYDWAANERSLSCVCCVLVGLGSPELPQKKDFDLVAAHNVTFPCAEQGILQQFLNVLRVGYVLAGGLPLGPPPPLGSSKTVGGG